MRSTMIIALSIWMTLVSAANAGNFNQDVSVVFGDQRVQIAEGGQLVTLSLDKVSGSGFQSTKAYLFGRFDIQMKLAPGNSAGTVSTFYLSSQGLNHDEVDFEFLGNASGQPYTLSTNVYSDGKGNREQQFHLWFDPTTSFHTYTVIWNPQNIIFLVDNIPIRVFNNFESIGVPFPSNKPMRVYCTLWDGEDWATQGGRVKTDWTKAPFVISYQNFNINGCVAPVAPGAPPCAQQWQPHDLDARGRNLIRWAEQKSMFYNYCTDRVRFPRHLPRECRHSRF